MRPWPVQHVNLNFLSLKEPIITKVCFKSFVTQIIKLYNFPNTSGKSILKLLWKVYKEEQHQYKQKYENSKRLCCPQGIEKSFSPRRFMTLKIPDMKP